MAKKKSYLMSKKALKKYKNLKRDQLNENYIYYSLQFLLTWMVLKF